MNIAALVGHLTADPKPFAENKGVNFTVAWNRKFTTKDGSTKEETSFFDCVSFRNVETILKYLKKGNRVSITGNLKQERWDQNGETRSKVVIMVRELDFLTPKGEGKGAAVKDETPEALSDEEAW
jgi:single-strand DNA-binding protein